MLETVAVGIAFAIVSAIGLIFSVRRLVIRDDQKQAQQSSEQDAATQGLTAATAAAGISTLPGDSGDRGLVAAASSSRAEMERQLLDELARGRLLVDDLRSTAFAGSAGSQELQKRLEELQKAAQKSMSPKVSTAR